MSATTRERALRGRRQRMRATTGYALGAPGTIWLALLFVTPLASMVVLSLESPVFDGGLFARGYRFTWNFATYPSSWSMFQPQFVRSIVFAFATTIAALLIGYPIAYWLAFRAGARRGIFLLLLLAPFFVSFVIRSLAWQFALSDDGPILGTMKSAGLVPEAFHALATPAAVIAGMTYNSLPYMTLPIYVALERLDVRLLEAGRDLYAGGPACFRHVVMPLSVPGVLAGMLLTFIPAAGDFVNAAILGGTGTSLIGNVIQYEFLQVSDYPLAAATAISLVALVGLPLVVYAKVVGLRSIESYV
jgi:spermidine/putrescine transport system permease protein